METMILRILFISRACFYLFLAVFAVTPDFQGLHAYSSNLLKNKETEKVNYYYSRHLEKLRKSVKPRFVNVIDTRVFSNEHNIVNSGILFTYKNYQAREVLFISSIDRYQPHKMIRNEKGVWYYILPRREFDEKIPSREILYKFVVDGLYIRDTTHENVEDDFAGDAISKFVFTDDMYKPLEGVLVLENDTPVNKKVIFRFYSPKSKFVSLIGSFNNWNSEMDMMKRNENGYFELEKSLPPGQYTYLFRADGKTILDKRSPELKYHPVYSTVGFFKITEGEEISHHK